MVPAPVPAVLEEGVPGVPEEGSRKGAFVDSDTEASQDTLEGHVEIDLEVHLEVRIHWDRGRG